MEQTQLDIYEKEYMPYIIKWGKITCWISIPLIFLPALALYLVYGARPSAAGVVTGFISLFSAMLAWYIVDPITLYPILHIPGMYMTYIAGNSKEIRAPAATAALSSADVEAGTPEGTIISCIAIATSIFVSLAVMTIVSVSGTVILSMLPEGIKTALNYLLPALFGARAAFYAEPISDILGPTVSIIVYALTIRRIVNFPPAPPAGEERSSPPT